MLFHIWGLHGASFFTYCGLLLYAVFNLNRRLGSPRKENGGASRVYKQWWMSSWRRWKSDGGKVRTCINPSLLAETNERNSSVIVKEMGQQVPHIFECLEFHDGVAKDPYIVEVVAKILEELLLGVGPFGQWPEELLCERINAVQLAQFEELVINLHSYASLTTDSLPRLDTIRNVSRENGNSVFSIQLPRPDFDLDLFVKKMIGKR